jgi:hypothetical protein
MRVRVDTDKADSRGWATGFLAILLALALGYAAAAGGAYALIPRTEASVLLWWTLSLGFVLGVLPRAQPSKLLSVALLGGIGLVAWVAASLLWTESKERTLIELTRNVGFVGVVLAIGWCFTQRAWRAGAVAATCAATGVCLIALGSRVAPAALTSPLTDDVLLRRLSFPLNYWNALGCWAAMTVALTLAWSAHAPRWPARAAALAGVCVATSVAYLTYSRSATAGVVIAAATVIAVSRHRWLAAAHTLVAAAGTAVIVVVIRAEPAIARGSGGEGGAVVALTVALVVAACPLAAWATSRAGLESVRTPVWQTRRALALVLILGLFAAVGVGPALASRAWDSFRRPTPAVTGDPVGRLGTLGGTRSALWDVALQAFERHPLGGTGAGTFEFVWNRNPDRTSFVRDAHSLYLESLGELGLPGALLVLTLLGALLVAAFRTTLRAPDAVGAGAGAGITAALVVFCVCAGVDWIWESTAVTVLALAVGTLAATAGARSAPPVTIARRLPLAVVMLLALAVQVPVLTAAVQLRVSQRAVRAGDMDRALSAANTAVQSAPWEASGYLQRALVLEELGVRRPAIADARRAVDREPTNWQHWLILARLEAEVGRVSAAVAHVRRAADLNPRAAMFRSQARAARGAPRTP